MARKPPASPKGNAPPSPPSRADGGEADDFDHVVGLIEAARTRGFSAVNKVVVELYWSIGEYIGRKAASEGWGKGTVDSLSAHIRLRHPNARGYSARNLWRMMQFHQAYRDRPKLSPLVTELSWSHNLLILNRCRDDMEREFYLRGCLRERWTRRELERQLACALFERVALSPVASSPAVAELHPGAAGLFKDSYLLDFLELPADHSESDLEAGLVEQLKGFLLELGRDFCFIGSQYPLQVGGRDFAVDLMFFNRALNCLVAFELKIDEFQPEHLGKLEFYLEALDRDVKKEHERPSIGVLLCATKDHDVVEYALSRAASPALVAEYRTKLPDKRLLRRKLREFYDRSRDGVDEV